MNQNEPAQLLNKPKEIDNFGKRMKKNNKNLDRLDQENEMFFKNSIQAYDYLAQKNEKKYKL